MQITKTINKSSIPTIEIDGIPIHNFSEEETAAWIIHKIKQKNGGIVVTVNLDHLYRASIDPNYCQILHHSDLVVADGTPLIWLSKLQGTSLKERVAGSSLIKTLSQEAAQEGFKIFLLGGNKGAAQLASQALAENLPSLCICGTYYPEIGFEDKPEELNKIRNFLTQVEPDIIFVALGSPKQEHLMAMMKNELPTSWWLGVGISFSYLAKEIRQAPEWMQRVGLEWLFRLFQEPKRLWKRYLLNDLPYAFLLVCKIIFNNIFGYIKRKIPRSGNKPKK